MRSSFTLALVLAFLLGVAVEYLVFNQAHSEFNLQAYLVVLVVVLILALLYSLYRRYHSFHLILARHHLEYLEVSMDGLSLCESLARRCEVLRHQRNDLNDDLIGVQVQLQEVNELSRLLLDKLPEASILVNQHGAILGVSQSAQLLTGYPMQEVFGASLGKLKLFDDLTELFEKGWSQELATRLKEVSTPHMGQLKGKGGKSMACTWSIKELNLPIHRYYLITLVPHRGALKIC